MIFEDLGPVLRAEREKKGLSIDDVALHLKISGRVIRALEDGDEDGLPHNVYVRGFVRAYSLFLGFNDEELSAALEAVEFEEHNPAPQAVYTPINESPLSRKKIASFIVALGIVAVGAYTYVEYANLFSDDIVPSTAVTSTATPAPPLMQPIPQANQQAASRTSPAATAPAGGAAQSAAAKTPAREAPPPQSVVSTPPVPPVVTPVKPQNTPAQSTAPPVLMGQTAQTGQPTQTVNTVQAGRAGQQDSHKVIITALAECWIHSNADDTDTRQFSLRKGDTFALTFSKKLTVKLGNAGGVRIRYDGEDLPVPGTSGQTRTLVFPPAP